MGSKIKKSRNIHNWCIYENLEDNNPTKKKASIVFDNTIADLEGNNKVSSIVTELFLRGIKLDISLVFISHSYFKVPI